LFAVLAVPLRAQSAADPGTAAIAFGPLSATADVAFRAWLDRTDLGRMIKRDASALKVARVADGTEILIVGEGFKDVLVATTQPTGKTLTTCIATDDGARILYLPSRAPRTREP
jgi:hypothetical protein